MQLYESFKICFNKIYENKYINKCEDEITASEWNVFC